MLFIFKYPLNRKNIYFFYFICLLHYGELVCFFKWVLRVNPIQEKIFEPEIFFYFLTNPMVSNFLLNSLSSFCQFWQIIILSQITKIYKISYRIFPLPNIRIVVDSGFKITATSFFLHTIGFSKINFNGDIDKNFAAFVCKPTFTRQPWFSVSSLL